MNQDEIIKFKLAPLFLEEDTLSRVAKGVARKLKFLNSKSHLQSDSKLYNFEEKVEKLFEDLLQYGATKDSLLNAIAKESDLLIRNPESIASNINEMESYCQQNGLDHGDFFRAALNRRPSLFCQQSKTLISHIESSIKQVSDYGIDRLYFLNAAIKQPALFAQKSGIIERNIERVTSHFSENMINKTDYARAMLKQPSIFYLNPETLIENIEEVTFHYSKYGLTTESYLKAAMMQPSLFYQKPRTIIRHINLISGLCARGLIGGQAEPHINYEQPVNAAINIMLKNPLLFSISDENIVLREYYSILCNTPHSLGIITKPRNEIERGILKSLGHDDSSLPIPKLGPDAGVGAHARNLLLRALVHEGFVKGQIRDR